MTVTSPVLGVPARACSAEHPGTVHRRPGPTAMLVAAMLVCSAAARAQEPCTAAYPAALTPRGETIFSPEQEGVVGDLIAEQLRLGTHVYDDPALTAPLERIAARLLAYLPEQGYRFQFGLIERPGANAFSLPGGRIYVSRRLVGLLHDEDELAGILAHEMGHVLARQASVDLTRVLRQTLGVTSVGDRDDIFRVLNALMDRADRTAGATRRERDDQAAADQVAAHAAWRAGYDPDGLPRFFDRLTDNRGETGGFLSDLFGLTRPESRRFRDMLRVVERLPPACRAERSVMAADAFAAWRRQVTELSVEDLLSSSAGRAPLRVLDLRLRPQAAHVRFSPDGAFLIAQDESGIDVIGRDPFAHRFRIPARLAHPAVFHHDSVRLLFQSAGPRLEIWNLRTQSRERVWEPGTTDACDLLVPSPDGRAVACTVPLTVDVRLFDLDTGDEIARHRFDVPNTHWTALLAAGVRPVQPAFSSDGSSFLATVPLSGRLWAYDLRGRAALRIGEPLRAAPVVSVTFVGTDRVALAGQTGAAASGLYSWPDGKLVERLAIPTVRLEAATSGPVVIMRPFREFAAAALNVETGEVFQATSRPALDFHGGTAAVERATGEIALFAAGRSQDAAILSLPDSSLVTVRAAVHSPDLQWLALSVDDRAAHWNLQTGAGALMRPFANPYISPDGVLTAYYEPQGGPAGQGQRPAVHRMSIDLARQTTIRSTEVALPEDGRFIKALGRHVVEVLPAGPGRRRPVLQVHDVIAERLLWSRDMDADQGVYVGNAVVLVSRTGGDGLSLDVLSLDTGEALGRVLRDRESGPRIVSILVAGDILFVEDSQNRTLAYSLETGARTGQQFGVVAAVDSTRGLAALQNQPGAITVVNSAMRPVATFAFPRNVIYAGFDRAGTRLLVLTGAHEVFIETLPDAIDAVRDGLR